MWLYADWNPITLYQCMTVYNQQTHGEEHDKCNTIKNLISQPRTEHESTINYLSPIKVH